MSLLELFARGSAITSGAILAYGALFLYEDEERAIQNTLEVWWIKVDDLRASALRRHIALLNTAAAMAASALARIFGNPLVSTRALYVSGLLSVVSLLLGYLIGLQEMLLRATAWVLGDSSFTATMNALRMRLAAIPPHSDEWPVRVAVAILAISIGCGVVNERWRWLPLVPLLTIIAIPLFLETLSDYVHHPFGGLPSLCLAMAVGIAGDALLVAVMRRVISAEIKSNSLAKMILVSAAQVLTALCVTLVPVLVGMGIAKTTNFVTFGWSLATTSSANLDTALVALSVFCLFFY